MANDLIRETALDIVCDRKLMKTFAAQIALIRDE